jgi:hypothetical protein
MKTLRIAGTGLVAILLLLGGYYLRTVLEARPPERNAPRSVRRIKALLAGECRPSGLMDVYYDACGK